MMHYTSGGPRSATRSVARLTACFAVPLMLLLATAPALAAVDIVANNPDRFEITFDSSDSFSAIAPVGAEGGRTVSLFSGGESAAIAISIGFSGGAGSIFVFENIAGDPFFPNPDNFPGKVLTFTSEDNFANIGMGGVSGSGVMPGFERTDLTVVVGPTREVPFTSARLTLSNATETELDVLRNGSFEDTDPGLVDAPWIQGGPTAARVVVTTEELDAPLYSELELQAPSPTDGGQMGRIGETFPTLREISENDATLEQTFITQTDTLSFDLRVFCAAPGQEATCVFETSVLESVEGDLEDLELPVSGFVIEDFALLFDEGGPFRGDFECSSTPCRVVLQDGFQNGFMNVTVSDLPVGRAVTLFFQMQGNGWVYVDNVQNGNPFDPVINYLPGPDARIRDPETLDEILPAPGGDNPAEGDLVVFDCTFTEGVSDTALDNCAWTVTSPLFDPMEGQGRYAMFLLPYQGDVDVTLSITEGDDTVSTTETVTVDNVLPLVNALDVEVGPDGIGEAVCRFADPGVDPRKFAEEFEAVFDFEGAEPIGDPVFQQERIPPFTSGFATQRFTTTDDATGSCTFENDVESSPSTQFDITFVDATELAARRDAKSDMVALADGAPLVAGQSVVGSPDAPGDIDLFKLVPPGHNPDDPLPPGTEFVATLTVPTDYDLLLLTESTSAVSDSPFENKAFETAPFVNVPFISIPFISIPFVNVPFVNAPFVNVPFVNVPFISIPFVNVPFVNVPFVNAPLTVSPFVNANLSFDQIPLSQVGLALPDGSNISGSDVGLDELGSGNLGALLESGLEATAYSAEDGDGTEKLHLKVTPGTQALYAAVVPNSNSISAAPYSLQVESSVRPPQSQLLGARCDGTELVTSGQTSAVEVLFTPSGDARTLIVTQRERMMATHFGSDPVAFNSWLASLAPFFNHPEVRAEVISVPSDDFVDADLNPCDVEAQNAATALVRGHIMNQIAGRPFRHIQIMGGLDIIGAHFSPDETTVGYEGLYAQDLLIDPATPLAVAIAEGNNITDAIYGTLTPPLGTTIPYRGRELFLESLPVGRLVETPKDIKDAADAFVATNGLIPITQAVASGYDFFTDGSKATAAVLKRIFKPSTDPGTLPTDAKIDELISEVWTGDDLRCAFTPDTADAALACPAPTPSVAAVNFHASYNGGLSAAGFNVLETTGLTEAEVIRSFEARQALEAGLTMSIGCHIGLSVPDAWGFPDAIGLPLDGAEDWAQQPGNLVGSWTFALGDDTVADRGTEGIVTLVAEELLKPAAEASPNGPRQTLGEALVNAKRRYAVNLFEFDVHDEKSLIGLGIFGMPQARLDVSELAPFEPEPIPGSSGPVGTLDIVVGFSDSSDLLVESPTFERVDPPEMSGEPDTGEYFPLRGTAQAVSGRPLLPTTPIIDNQPVPAGQSRTHDVLLLGGTFTDEQNFDPVYAVPQHDWVTENPEPRACVETFSPSQLGIVTAAERSLPEGGSQLFESVIVVGAQFKCTLTGAQQADPNQPVTGTLRRYTSLSAEAQRPQSASPILAEDFTPPVVAEQRLEVDPATGDVLATLDVADTNGMHRIVALIYRDVGGGAGVLEKVDTLDNGPLSGPGPFTMRLPNAAGVPVAFQYVDNAGNVLLKTGKGLLLAPLAVNIVTDTINPGPQSSIVVDLPGATSLTDAELNLNFGDGTFGNFVLFDAAGDPNPGVQLDPDGNARVTVPHDYSGEFGPGLTVTATARGSGAEGFTSKNINVVVMTCDANANSTIDIADIQLILGARGQTVPPVHPAFDPDGDGVISLLDARRCMFMCTNPRCAP